MSAGVRRTWVSVCTDIPHIKKSISGMGSKASM